jgi:hypothetical protein
MKKKVVLAFLACFSLLIAGLIYLCLRPNNILFFKWLDMIGFNYSVFQYTNLKLPNFVIYNLNNALFLIFGYIFLYIIWDNNKLYFIFYMTLITLLNIIYEIITNDISDIITILVTFTICFLIYIKYFRVKYEK